LNSSIFLKQSARSLVAAFALLSAVAAAAGSDAARHPQPEMVAQLALPKRDGAELIVPQQAPAVRLSGRPSFGMRSKAPSKKKPLVLTIESPIWRASARAPRRDQRACVKPIGFLLLRTQHPRAPPLSLFLASNRSA